MQTTANDERRLEHSRQSALDSETSGNFILVPHADETIDSIHSTFAHVDDYDEHVSKDPGVQLHRTPEAKHSSKNRDRSSRRAQVTPSGITSITNDLGILRKEQQCPSRGQTSSKRKRSPASESEDYGPTSFRSSTPERETFEPQILPQASVILPQQSAKHNKGIHLSDPDVRKLLFRNVPDTMDDQTGDGYLSEQELVGHSCDTFLISTCLSYIVLIISACTLSHLK